MLKDSSHNKELISPMELDVSNMLPSSFFTSSIRELYLHDIVRTYEIGYTCIIIWVSRE